MSQPRRRSLELIECLLLAVLGLISAIFDDFYRLFLAFLFYLKTAIDEMQSKFNQNAAKMQSKCSQNAVKMQTKCSQNAVKILSKFNQNTAKMQLKCSQNAVKMQSKCSQDSAKKFC